MQPQSTTTSNRVVAPDIHVRRMDFEFDDSIPKYWFDNNPHLTMFLTAFSATFPEGEMGFVRSVRAFQSTINSPKLQAEVRAFIGQEAHHGKEHDALNQLMERKGVAAQRISDRIKAGIAWYEKRVSPARFLAHTCAAEHLTAIFAAQVLSHPERLDVVDARVRPLLLWHSVEESEHKAVAFDVYKDQVDNYWIRVGEMALVTLMMSVITLKHTHELLRTDGQAGNFASAKRAISYLYGKQGLLSGILPKYLSYYRPNFHPKDHDTQHLLDRGIALLQTYVGDKAVQAA